MEKGCLLVMCFELKKFISQFLMLFPLFVLGMLGFWLLSKIKRLRVVAFCGMAALGIALLFAGYGVPGNRYLDKLERMYPPLESKPDWCEGWDGASILVLGQGMIAADDFADIHKVNGSYGYRIAEGARVMKAVPNSMLYISIPGEDDSELAHEERKRVARAYLSEYGVAIERVVFIPDARDTEEEFLKFAALKPKPPYVVATSAAHIPRAMKIGRKVLGVGENDGTLVAAPCDYKYLVIEPKNDRPFRLWRIPLPSVLKLENSEYAWYEWLGNLFESMKGK